MRTIPLLAGLLAVVYPAWVESGPVKRVVFLYSVNNSGYVDVCGCKYKKVKQGSLSRRFTVIQTIRAQGKSTVVLDGGSCLFPIQDRLPPSYERKQLKAKALVIVESMNRMGYQAMALGSSDLLLGLNTVKELASEARFPILSANFVDPAGTRIFPASTIVEAGGLRIGVVGLIVGTLNPHYIEKVAPGCRVLDPVAAAAKEVAALRKKVDLIVALSHVRREENQKLAVSVPEISIIFDPNINYGSHSLFMSDPSNYTDRFGRTLIVRADGEGMRLARVDLEFEQPFGEVRTSAELNRLERGVSVDPIPEDLSQYLGRGKFNRAVVSRISIEPHFLADPGIEALVTAWKTKDPGSIDEATLKALKASPLRFAGKDACKDCHLKQYEFWEKTAHATAYNSLRERGDHLRYDCVPCHTVGFGHAFLDLREAPKHAGVQCECCHGANPDHVKDPDNAPPWPKITENTCLTCHNEHQIRVKFAYRKKRPLVTCPRMEEPKDVKK